MTGLLLLNHDRPDIVLETGALYGGLHCGDCFQCLSMILIGYWYVEKEPCPFPMARKFRLSDYPTTNLFVFFKNFAGIGRPRRQVIFIGLEPSCFT